MTANTAAATTAAAATTITAATTTTIYCSYNETHVKVVNCAVEIVGLVINDMCREYLRGGLQLVFSPDNNPLWTTRPQTPTN